MDDELVRNGAAEIFLDVEPLAGVRNVAVTERRTKIAWARYIKDLLELRYSDADKVVLETSPRYFA